MGGVEEGWSCAPEQRLPMTCPRLSLEGPRQLCLQPLGASRLFKNCFKMLIPSVICRFCCRAGGRPWNLHFYQTQEGDPGAGAPWCPQEPQLSCWRPGILMSLRGGFPLDNRGHSLSFHCCPFPFSYTFHFYSRCLMTVEYMFSPPRCHFPDTERPSDLYTYDCLAASFL